MSNKCLIWVRASTDRQETESQLKETIEYAKSLRFDEFEIINKAGASAYKVNKLYLQMIDEMKSKILADPDIKAVVCWHLNRLARNESMAMDIKDFLIEHKIQLYVNEPTIKLFNNDGTINEGAELIFSLFATMSKQQVSELRLKVKRAKKRDKALHKYIGGNTVAYGYRINEDNYLEPDPETSKIVQDIFDLYGSGNYSFLTLAKEINERYGTDMNWHYMYSVLHNTKFYDGTMYPPIITELQYRKAEKQRNDTASRPMQSIRHTFANRIIKCPVCGKGLTANRRDYRCRIECKTGNRIGIPNMDGLLWTIASHLESDRLLNASAKDDYVEKQAVLASKIKSAEQSLAKGEKKAERGKKMALEGLIEIEEYKDILRQVENDQKEVKRKVDEWKSEIAEIDRLISEDGKDIKRILELSDRISYMDEEQMKEIVRRWVKKVTYTSDWVFTIETITRTYKARYVRYDRQYNRWFTLNNNPIATRQLYRDKDGCSFGDVRISPVDIPITMAWLSGSEIV